MVQAGFGVLCPHRVRPTHSGPGRVWGVPHRLRPTHSGPGRVWGAVSTQGEAHTQCSRFDSSSGHFCMSSSLIPTTAFTRVPYNTSGYLKDTIMNTHLCHLKPITWAGAAKTRPYITVPMIHDQSYTTVIVCYRWTSLQECC